VSKSELSHAGASVPMDEFIGDPHRHRADRRPRLPDVSSTPGASCTGRTIHSRLPAGRVDDLLSRVRASSSETFEVPFPWEASRSVFAADLAGLLGMTLIMGGTQGIVGNAILRGRIVGYFPRRRLLVL
jgi:hypothetical protein